MNLGIIELKSPYDTLGLARSQEIFSNHVYQRIESYKQRYGDGVFPLGSEDFVCDHFLIVDKDAINQKILGSFKIIDLKQCERFKLDFPLLHTLKYDKNDSSLLHKVSAYIGKQKMCSYIGGMTICPSVLNDSVLRRHVRHLISTAQVFCVLERGYPELLVTGSIPNKSYHYLEWMGLEKFDSKPVVVKDLDEVQAYVMILKQWSDSVIKMAQKLEECWSEREIIAVMCHEENRVAS
jgi:hypothetical protein